jgi:signal transduction histidine kinase/FixJ family two-component response regulator
MNIHLFGKATAGVIVLAALAFLGLFAAGHVASPTLMTPWSSLAYLAIGCSLWIDSSSKSGAPVRAGAVLVFVIGAVVCGEYLAGEGPTAFDQLIFRSHLPTAALLPGRPAPIAGFRFCLLGLVLFLVRARNKPLVLVREWSAIAVIIMCYFGFVSVVSEWGTASPKSISPTAGILGILAAANILATGQNGRFVPLLQDRGPAGMIARSLMPVAMILPVVNTILGLVFARFHLYDFTGKVALLSINILTAITILWIGASKVLSIDLLRRKAEDDLRASHDQLDRRVQVRTQELVDANQRLAVEVANRRLAQDELQRTNAMLGSLIEACPLAIVAFKPDGSVRIENAAAEAMRLAQNPECRALADRAGRGETVANADLTCEVHGKTLHLSIWASPILTEDARLDGVVMMAADVTERKALEAHIQQNQRLESIGVLAGGIAHDFNNLLTGVMGNASFLQDISTPGSREAHVTADLIEASQAMAKLTAQMLAYSGRSRFIVEPLDLSTEVRRITHLVQASIPKNVRLGFDLGESMPSIEADASQLQQVVMNLVINGAEALGAEQGTVEVRTLARRAEQAELASSVLQPPVPAGEYVMLEVRDTGAGMDEETKMRIFDPFFTTKFTGRGLGLSAVLGIVRAHRGALIVESRAGFGTTFRIFFPCSARVPAPRETFASHRGSGVVLVVDDEDLVRRIAQSALDAAGYEVLTATNGREALDVCDARSGRIDAVLLDMTMPIMGGEEAMAQLVSRWPDVAVIATSGYDREEAERRFAPRPAGFLQKPYTAAQLSSKIAEVLRSSGKPSAAESVCEPTAEAFRSTSAGSTLSVS